MRYTELTLKLQALHLEALSNAVRPNDVSSLNILFANINVFVLGFERLGSRSPRGGGGWHGFENKKQNNEMQRAWYTSQR